MRRHPIHAIRHALVFFSGFRFEFRLIRSITSGSCLRVRCRATRPLRYDPRRARCPRYAHFALVALNRSLLSRTVYPRALGENDVPVTQPFFRCVVDEVREVSCLKGDVGWVDVEASQQLRDQ